MAQILNENWLDQNADRAYPLMDGVTGLDTTATFTLPTDLLVDLNLAAPANLDVSAFFISKVSAFGSGLIITFAVDGVADIATVTVPLDGFTDFSQYTVTGLPGYTQVGGTATIGTGLAALAASAGIYTFLVATTRLLPTVISPAAPSVSSITFVDAFGGETQLTGAITLAAGDNALLGVAGQTISIGMETAVLIEDPCPCTDSAGRARTSIKSINGVVPDDAGNIDLVPIGCVQIETDTGAIKLKDSCATPCCGEAEIQLLVDAAKNLDRFMAGQANKSAELEAALRILTTYLVQ